MATSVDFSDNVLKLLDILKEKYKVKTNRAVLEKALKISAVSAEEQDDLGGVITQGKDNTKTRLILAG